MANRERLEKTLAAVELAAVLETETGESLREGWNQRYWAVRTTCGTSMCVAGWACHLAGDTFLFQEPSYAGVSAEYVRTAEGEKVPIQERAADLLGLTLPEAEILFDGFNNLRRIREIVGQILARQAGGGGT